MKCDACGKQMTQGQETVVGTSFALHVGKPVNNKRKAFLQKQLGKYEMGRTYGICYECVLKNVGIKSA